MAVDVLRTDALDPRERHQLLTSLVVPRPIAWVSTYDVGGGANLAPFSYFNGLASSPMLLGVSMGYRRSEPKDSLRNVQASGAFCVNVVTEELLAAMSETAGEFGPEVDEFAHAGLAMASAEHVRAPYVADCPAVMECALDRVVELGEGAAALVVGRVEAVRLSSRLRTLPGSRYVDTKSLRPVGRLAGRAYGLLGEIVRPDGSRSD